jgi:hypothetical protein
VRGAASLTTSYVPPSTSTGMSSLLNRVSDVVELRTLHVANCGVGARPRGSLTPSLVGLGLPIDLRAPPQGCTLNVHGTGLGRWGSSGKGSASCTLTSIHAVAMQAFRQAFRSKLESVDPRRCEQVSNRYRSIEGRPGRPTASCASGGSPSGDRTSVDTVRL